MAVLVHVEAISGDAGNLGLGFVILQKDAFPKAASSSA